MLLTLVWTLFAVCTVATFLMIAAYWLDVQDRADLTIRARIGWSAATLLFPLSIPAYAFVGRPDWPPVLMYASFIPAFTLALLAGFLLGLFS